MPKKAEEKPTEVIEEIIVEEVEVQEPQAEQESEPKAEAKTTKAGKHSAKARREAEELAEKEDRKAKIASGEIEDPAEVKKGPKPVTRSKTERRSKKYKAVAKDIEKDKTYSSKDALSLAKKTSTTSFDSTVEIHVRLGVDPRHADQNIRSTVTLPAGTGKDVNVAVWASKDLHAAAKKAGADAVYEDEFLDKLKKEDIDFEVLITTPENMPKLAKFARVLGPKGLMPSPKAGTVSKDVVKATQEAKAGKIEYRVDKQGIIHTAIGKTSFSNEDLNKNYDVVMQSIKDAKPSSVKGVYIKSIYITTTMGPSVSVEV
jgi:large subunit ribosomal protein L1